MVHGLSCSKTWGIFPDQGLNPCLLHWQLDSLQLSQQRSPLPIFNQVLCFYPFSLCTRRKDIGSLEHPNIVHPAGLSAILVRLSGTDDSAQTLLIFTEHPISAGLSARESKQTLDNNSWHTEVIRNVQTKLYSKMFITVLFRTA